MRLQNKIESIGYFWLPQSPEAKLPGTLTISECGAAKLSLIGHFGDVAGAMNGAPRLGRLVGLLENGEPILLEQCLYIKRNFSFGGISKQILHPRFVMIGVGCDHDESDDPLKFSKMRFAADGLDEWLGISGIERTVDFSNQPSARIEFRLPEDRSVTLESGLVFSITFESTFPGRSITEARLTQRAFVELAVPVPQELDAFLRALARVSNLLTFAIGDAIAINSVIGFSTQVQREGPSGQQRKVPIRIYYEGADQPGSPPKAQPDRVLFSFGQVQGFLKRVLDSWHKNYDVAEPAFNLYFSSKTGRHAYLESRFLALAQGLETLHRRNYPTQLFPESEYEALCQGLIKSCPPHRKEWLESKLRYGNELPLRARIKQLLAPYRQYFGAPGMRKRLIAQIIDTRNYLTHYDHSLESRAVAGNDLWVLCMRMEALFELHLLAGLGLSCDEIGSIVASSGPLKHRLSGGWK